MKRKDDGIRCDECLEVKEIFEFAVITTKDGSEGCSPVMDMVKICKACYSGIPMEL